jgi:uncharacterized protein YcnI
MKRVLVPAAAAALFLVATAVPASAHVTVVAPGATVGGFTKLTFRAPTEKGVPTTKLDVTFPADAPIAFVSVKPHPGWTYAVTKGKPAVPVTAHGENITEVVTRIVWTAAPGNGIKPGEFDEFEVSAGPLPDVETLTFKALQTYADGDVVRWIEDAPPGGEEPEHPAPVLHVAKAEPAASPSASASASTATTATRGEDDDEDGDATGVAGLAVGALALLVAVAAFARGRRGQAG